MQNLASSSRSNNTAHFLPLPPLSLRTPPPPYRYPTIITTYSHQPDRCITHDDTSMAYYNQAPIGCDLNYGFESKVERDEDVDEHLDGLCEALMEAHEKHDQRGDGGEDGDGNEAAERKGGIITWRGMITRIMIAPYEPREPWEMTAIALDGSVYVELHDPPEIRQKRRKDQSSWAWQSYMGYAFESFSTTTSTEGNETKHGDGVHTPEGWGGGVNTNVQVSRATVVRSAIGDIPLCLGGEVDCVRAEVGTPHPGLNKCVELKTNKVIYNEKQDAIFHKKLLKHWAQSWLLGIPEIQVGFRDDAGILKSQRGFETEKIPRFIASLPDPPWSTTPPLHFLHAVLNLVTTHVLPTDPLVTNPHIRGNLGSEEILPPADVWRFSFVPRRGCELYRVGEVGVVDGRWGGVMKEDYVRWRMGRGR
ncbi:protein RAI1 [Kwoniella heveanensis CBS 569]|uniref:Decapping nuclease n=1 Tax=Kwoniella heveanensis BCC8398 TaxID=1296120 RepID=A0A1B9GXF0_9TREE|nr:protein RAI1 [Kwoniella heveanensis BCC8398]OCF39560.1 protein RAI1 [Kwoniella heveanensis CBS 569]